MAQVTPKKISSVEDSSPGFQLSIPGISHAKERGRVSPTRKAIWLSLFCLGLGLTGYQVINVVEDYWRYPIRTKISVTDQSMQPLPAVTVCSFNKIRCSDFSQFVLNCYQNDSCPQSRWEDYCIMTYQSGCGFLLLHSVQASFIAELFQKCPALTNITTIMATDPGAGARSMDGDLLTEKYSYLRPEERIGIGMKMDTMVTKCTIGGKTDCRKYFNITTMNTVQNGNCFTFNGGGEVGDVQAGPSMGMAIEFKLNKAEFSYTPENENEGLRVVIHEPNLHPLVEERGINVLPGTRSSFALKLTHLARQPDPYSAKCISRWIDTTIDFPDDLTEGDVANRLSTYTMTSCSRTCILIYIMDQCNCVWHTYDDYNVRDYHRKEGYTPNNYCSPKNDEQFNCIMSKMRKYDKASCGCNPNCDEVVYDAKVASSKWPSEIQWVYQALNNNFTFEMKPINYTKIFGFDSSEDSMAYKKKVQESIMDDMAKVEVYFGTSMQTNIDEEPIYPSVFDLFINLGGALSLWMGLSFIMIVEVIEVVVDIFVACIVGGTSKSNTQSLK